MKKTNKSLLLAIFCAMTISGCQTTTSSTEGTTSSTGTTSTTSNVSTSTSSSSELSGDVLILDELLARVMIAQNNTSVLNNFNLPASVKYAEYVGNITWESDSGYIYINPVKTSYTDSASGATYDVYQATVVRPENGEGDALVRLTATVEYNGLTGTKTQKVTVPEAGPSTTDTWGTLKNMTISSWTEWIAKDSGMVAVQGVITGMVYQEQYSNANVFLQDEDGGYYAYAVGEMSEDEANNYLAVGNEVIFEGEKSIYNGLHEFNQEKVTGIKVISRDNTFDAVDVTEAAKNDNLRKYQAMWVKATGMFVQEEGKSYMKFNDNKYEIYHSAKYSGAAFDVVEEQLKEITVGDTVEITGFIGCYNADQFHPYNMVKVEGEEMTDLEKVELALTSAESALFSYKNVTIDAETEIALYASADETVTVSYSLNEEADTEVYVLDTENNKLTVKPVEDTKEATLTITVTCGNETKTSTFAFTACSKLEILTVEEALAIATEQEYDKYADGEFYVQGTLGEITNSTYGNTTLVSGETKLTVYGMYGDDDCTVKYGNIEGEKPVAGDIVILKGQLGKFKDSAQLKNAYIYDFSKVLTVEEALAIATEQEYDKYAEGEFYVKGTLGEITNSTYGNTTLVSGETKLTVYGMYGDDDCTVKYGNIEGEKPVAGDIVVLKGQLGKFKDSAQLKNGYIYSFEKAKVEDDTQDPEEPGNPTVAPYTFDFKNHTGANTSYGEYKDVVLDGQGFTLSCGNQYNKDNVKTGIAVGINKAGNLSKAGALPAAVETALGDKALTGDNVINAALEMDFDVTGVTSVTYNLLKVGYGGDVDTTVYILRSVDAGTTYSVVASCDKSASSISYTEETKAESVRYALVVTGGVDANYGAYTRVSTLVFA